MPCKRLLALLFIAIAITSQLSSSDAQESDSLALYEPFELSFVVEGEYENPYDPAEVNVMVNFTPPNTTQAMSIPAFFMQPYAQTCETDCEAEILEADGAGEWRVRFTPTMPGRWRYSILVGLNGNTPRAIEQSSFSVSETMFESRSNHGFVRVAPNQRYFMFEDGTPYFPVGENLGWSWAEGGGIFTYLDWLDKLTIAGANYARIFIDVPWFIGLEWTAPAGQYGGAGQEAAWRLDTIINEAAQRGIYLQLVLIWHQDFQQYEGNPVLIPDDPARPDQDIDFDDHPYNSRFSGSLGNPGGVFRDPISFTHLQNRLRYIVARWGYSPNVFAWELVNSLDEMTGYSVIDSVTWANGLITTLREFDPFDHLVTVGLKTFNLEVLQNLQMDFTQARLYQNRPIESTGDQVALTLEAIAQGRAVAQRPVLLTEFSLNRWFEPTADDERGVHIESTLWASVLAGAAGGAMTWWWDTYIDPQDLYPLLTPIRLFAEGVAWHELDLQLLEPGLVADTPTEYETLHLDGFNRQFRSTALPDTIYHITADGTAPPLSLTTSYLYGRQFNAENSRPQTFIVSPSVDTVFTLRIENVSTAADAQLVVMIDGETRNVLDLTAGTRGLNLNFPLTAGQHTIVLDNLGQDWLQIEYLEIENYRAPLRALALVDHTAGVALAWVHQRAYTWDKIQSGETLTPLQFQLNFPQMVAGVYRVEFWDTNTGNMLGEEQWTVGADGVLSIDLLPVEYALALRVFRISGETETPVNTPMPTRTPSVNP